MVVMGVSQENTHYEIAETVFSVEGQNITQHAKYNNPRLACL